MKPHVLLSRFDLIVDSPDNIQLLRKLVINLALSGRLLDASGDDRSLAEIRSEIALKREAFIKEGRIKKARVLPPIDQAELPAGCQDAAGFNRLGDIAILEKGLTAIQSAEPGDYPLVVTAEGRSSCDHYDFDGCAAIIPMVSSSGHGDASLKRLHYQEGKFALGNILCAAFPVSSEFVSARFIFEYLTAFKEELLVAKMIGTANVSLTLGKIDEVPIPIVSIAVQRRVDELMALCDRLETAKTERERKRDQLATASLHQLNNGANADSFRQHAQFYFDNLPSLTTRVEHIERLRDTILDLAVRGKLVPQEPNDEPASALLREVQTEKARLEKARLIPKQKPVQTDTHDPKGGYPAQWESASLGNACNLVTSGSRGWAEFYSESGPKFIRAQNIRFGRLRLDDLACVTLPKNTEGTRTQVSPGDLLVVITGAGVTNPALLDQDLGEAYVSQHVALIKPTKTELSRWLLLCLMAPAGGRTELLERAYGAGKPGLNLDNIRSLRIPIPPLAEQRRILAKVEELTVLCDQLETQLAATQTESRRLLEAVLHEALNPTTSVVEAA